MVRDNFVAVLVECAEVGLTDVDAAGVDADGKVHVCFVEFEGGPGGIVVDGATPVVLHSSLLSATCS